jgi:hypothetical protein
VTLTGIWNTGRRWEASYYDQGNGPRDPKKGYSRRINTEGANEFTIKDRFGNEVLKGEVVYIAESEVIFRAGGKFYRLRLGGRFQDAVASPLSAAEVKKLGINPSPGD